MTPRDRFQKIVGETPFRPLDPWERALAHSVFQASIPYDRVFLTDFGLGGAVTLCHLSPRWPALYAISWKAGLLTTRAPADQPATLIHELSHVWQGENGVAPGVYMLQSIFAQGVSGIGDWLRGGEWKGWDHHRGATYRFTAKDIGRPWREFNVEQQASLVQSWFMNERDRIVRVGPRTSRTTNFGDGVFGGGCSIHDPRFPISGMSSGHETAVQTTGHRVRSTVLIRKSGKSKKSWQLWAISKVGMLTVQWAVRAAQHSTRWQRSSGETD